VTPFIVVKLNDNENTPDPLIVDDANDDGTFEMPGLRPHRDDDSSDDEDDDVSTPKKMGHRQKRKGLFDAKTLCWPNVWLSKGPVRCRFEAKQSNPSSETLRSTIQAYDLEAHLYSLDT
jgi:hypothetical protein